MKIYAISDLHLPGGGDKPMDIFGGSWSGHINKIKEDWQSKVAPEDYVLLAGDFSWAMTLDGAASDFEILKELPGTKVMLKGNHDYWWSSVTRNRQSYPDGFVFIQNDAVRAGNYIICGSRGWSVPGTPEYSPADEKIYIRETQRLKMSFAAAKKLAEEGDKIICMMHFPPFNANRDDTAFTKSIDEAEIDKVVYGHLHGTKSRTDLTIVKNRAEYILTSCDKLDFKLAKIY